MSIARFALLIAPDRPPIRLADYKLLKRWEAKVWLRQRRRLAMPTSVPASDPSLAFLNLRTMDGSPLGDNPRFIKELAKIGMEYLDLKDD